MIQDIYQKQLEAILFSVNQYSDDVLNSWISRIETDVETGKKGKSLEQLTSFQPAIQFIFVSDTAHSLDGLTWLYSSGQEDSARSALQSLFKKESEGIRQLISYKKSGFQKAKVLAEDHDKSSVVIAFIIGDEVSGLRLAGIVLDPEQFVGDLVGPRLQVVGKDQFTLKIGDKSSGRTIYSTLAGDTTSVKGEALTKDFWIFPDYVLGIHTQGATIRQIVRDRTRNNMALLLGLDVVLIIALVWTFRSVKREVQLAQNKADFVSNVSHEIRTPLALISMFAETLEMNRVRSEEKKQEYYGIISKEAHRLTGIVNKILNFSQTEAGKKIMHLEPLQPQEEIKAVLHTYDYHLRNKGFSYEWKESTPFVVRGDKEAFAEILVNLIDNAVKYSAEQKSIEIRTGVEKGEGWVAVSDKGVGISAADQKHIFDKFYRVPAGDLARARGTGLGLSLVKQLVEQQGGRITVSSEPGKGSTFTFYLPLADH